MPPRDSKAAEAALPDDVQELQSLKKRLGELQNRQTRLDHVLHITRLLAAEMSLDRLLPLIAAETCEALNTDRATIYLIDHERQELWTKAVSKLEITEIRLPLGTGLAGRVAQTGVTLLIPDCYTDPRFDQSWDKKTGYRTRNMLLMGMDNSQGDRLGVFQIINKQTGDFDYDDMTLLHSIAASAAIALENAQLYEAQQASFNSMVVTLASTVDARDHETSGHSQRVSTTSELLGQKMGLTGNDLERVRLAGMLHDYGKIGVPDAVLTKPGRLSDEERDMMNSHPRFTHEILQNIKFLRGFEDIPNIAAQHHERLDGKGYPYGLHDEQLTLGGRILAVADIYDALRMKRYYKPSFSIGKSLDIIREMAGTALDFEVVEALDSIIPEIEAAVGHLRPGTETDEPAEQKAEEAHPAAAEKVPSADGAQAAQPLVAAGEGARPG